MRPVPCESCAAGKPRAYCPSYPRPCEDLIEIWDDAREATLLEIIGAGSIDYAIRLLKEARGES